MRFGWVYLFKFCFWHQMPRLVMVRHSVLVLFWMGAQLSSGAGGCGMVN